MKALIFVLCGVFALGILAQEGAWQPSPDHPQIPHMARRSARSTASQGDGDC